MSQFFAWLSPNVIAALSILGAAVAFVVSTWLQVNQRRAEANERQFHAYHDVLDKVVSPKPTNGLYYWDRQVAFIFELRHFPRYYDLTDRLLTGIRKKWLAEATPASERLIAEVDLTLKYIESRK
jgi:hypothetical protein